MSSILETTDDANIAVLFQNTQHNTNTAVLCRTLICSCQKFGQKATDFSNAGNCHPMDESNITSAENMPPRG